MSRGRHPPESSPACDTHNHQLQSTVPPPPVILLNLPPFSELSARGMSSVGEVSSSDRKSVV